MEALNLLDPRQQCSVDPGLRQGLLQGYGATHPMRPAQLPPGAVRWAEAGAAARPGEASEMGRGAAAALAEELGDRRRAGAGGCRTITVER